MTDLTDIKMAKREGNRKELQLAKLKDIRDKIDCVVEILKNENLLNSEYHVVEAKKILLNMLHHKWGLPSQVVKDMLKNLGYQEMWVMEAIYKSAIETNAEFFLTDEELESWLKKGGWSFGKEDNGYFAEKENSRTYHITKQWISKYSSRY